MRIHLNVMLVAAMAATVADRAAAQTAPAAPQPAAQPSTASGTTDLGGGYVSDTSAKAGEYNGLGNKGGFVIGNIDFRGGGAPDSTSAFRWRVVGTDLGLETRNLTTDFGVQGRYRATFGYDELLRDRSDSYQTPYLGTGTNTLTLPASWLLPMIASSSSSNNRGTSLSLRGLVPAIGSAPYIDTQTGSPTIGGLLTPNAAQLAVINAAQAADLPLFHNLNLSTKRTTFDAGFHVNLNPDWTIDQSVRAQHKDGMKPLGALSLDAGGNISTIIPDLIDTDTEQITATVTYHGKRGYLQSGYYGSFFTNHVTSMRWQNWASPTGTMDTMSSTPSDAFNQFNVDGHYNFSSATRLTANGSYGRTTQNDIFLTDASTPVVPVTSLNGLVVSKVFGARLTSRLNKKTNTTFAYKFDGHDNQTPVNIFQYADAGEAVSANANFPASATNPLGAVVAQNANANRPYSNRTQKALAELDYQFAKGEWVKAGYDYERINRWCTGSWIDCVDEGITNENTARVEWRANAGQQVNIRVEYRYSVRRGDYNENAFLGLVPYANVSPATALGGATAYSFMIANGWNGWGPDAGYAATTGNMNLFFPSNNALANTTYANANRISEIQGLRRFYVADRDRNTLRSKVNWQTSESFSLGGGADVTDDAYTDSGYGLQSNKRWSANADGTYEKGHVTTTLFYSYEQGRGITTGNTYTANSNTANVNGFTTLSGNLGCDTYTTLQQRNNNNKLDPCLNWSANMFDRVNTLGLTVAAKASKADLSANFIMSRANSTNDVTGGSWANNPLALPGAPAGTVAAFFIPAAPLPIVITDSTEVRLNATFALREHHSLRVIYAYMWMHSVDWAYDGMQLGLATISTVLPTQETPFNYGVHVIAVSYVITF